MEAEADVVAGTFSVTAVLEGLYSTCHVVGEITDAEVMFADGRVFANKIFHGAYAVIKVKICPQQLGVTVKILIQLVVQEAFVIKIVLVYGEVVYAKIHTSFF